MKGPRGEIEVCWFGGNVWKVGGKIHKTTSMRPLKMPCGWLGGNVWKVGLVEMFCYLNHALPLGAGDRRWKKHISASELTTGCHCNPIQLKD